ncbi:lamin tail domain-containing protein [Halorubrum ezzemoulense]|uniref:lamin tail domain-containing protein n=1 Tax=Halorubrum ezzemoulense TaxID=337243 RepID=UPI00211ACB06|nr:lamin tail domain-containing protein [Halorubrum ezzemoulense]
MSSAEVTAVADFAAAGGAVILLGSAADTDALSNFDPVVSELGTDVELTDTAVTDAQNNLTGVETVPTTTNFDTAGFSELFTPFTADDPSAGGSLDLVTVNEDTEGDDLAEPQENVVFENSGDSALDLTGYTVSDATSKEYQFPDGFTLQSGAQVTLYSGTGDDMEAELYWGQSARAIWNNGGDTVNVIDDTGTTVIDESY